MDILKIENATKRYNDFLLDNVSFTVPGGSVVGFVGENGAGKSTTLKAISGLVRLDGGRIECFGKDVRTLTESERSRIGTVLDDACLPSSVRLKDVGTIMAGMMKNWDSAAYAALLKKFGLSDALMVRELSKGMRMKAAIAVAMSHHADLLLLDEATSGLDPVARDEILDMLYEFVDGENRAVLVSSHIVEDLEKICDYIVFIHKGRIVFVKSADELREEYGIVSADETVLRALPRGAVLKVRRTPYSTAALVDRRLCGLAAERAGIDEIILFYAKGEDL